jgi:hypothetical protein
MKIIFLFFPLGCCEKQKQNYFGELRSGINAMIANTFRLKSCQKLGDFDLCCQMVYFQTKNTNLGKFLKGLAMEDVGIFRANLCILRPNGIFYGRLVHFAVIWCIHNIGFHEQRKCFRRKNVENRRKLQ